MSGAKGVILQHSSEYGIFPESKAKCGTSTLVCTRMINFSARRVVRRGTRLGGGAARRYCTRVRTHMAFPNESLFDGPWGGTRKRKEKTRRVRKVVVVGRITAPKGGRHTVEFFPPPTHVKFYCIGSARTRKASISLAPCTCTNNEQKGRRVEVEQSQSPPYKVGQ